MGMTIINFWKIFPYGAKREHNGRLIGIREFLEQLALYCFNKKFSTDNGTPEKKTPPLDEVNEEETFSTSLVLNFSSSVSPST